MVLSSNKTTCYEIKYVIYTYTYQYWNIQTILQINFKGNIGFYRIDTITLQINNLQLSFIENIGFSGNKRDFISMNDIYFHINAY